MARIPEADLPVIYESARITARLIQRELRLQGEVGGGSQGSASSSDATMVGSSGAGHETRSL